MKKNMLFIAIAAVLVSTTGALANLTPVHQWSENYYVGGTIVKDLGTGNTVMTFGDPIGTSALWEVTEKVWYDYDNSQTVISYTVFNDNLPQPITSLHIYSLVSPVAISSGPTGWSSYAIAGEYGWSTGDAANGIPVPLSLDTMVVTFNGLLGITFVPVAYDFADGTPVTDPGWMVSTVVPAPAGVVLCGLGLGLVGWVKRRFA